MKENGDPGSVMESELFTTVMVLSMKENGERI